MRKEYTEFSIDGESYKAFHSIENLYRIENTGINLNELSMFCIESTPSLTQTKNILDVALTADCRDDVKRKDFIKRYIDQYRFIASTNVRKFILSALASPVDTDGDSEKKSQTPPTA